MHRTRQSICVLAITLLATAALSVGGVVAATTPATTINPALRDAPGYKPLVDPESTSVRLGRRLNAPLVSMRFSDGATSMEHLGRMLVHAIHHTSVDSLRRLCLTLDEYAGQHLAFVRWDRTDTVAVFRNFRLHNGLSLVVRDESGREIALPHVRAVAERRGQFKLQSLRD